MPPWTIEYQPKNLSELYGQDKAVAQVRKFIEDYKKGKKKALILNGPPGCGKTSMVVAASKELNYELFEVNASDKRNKESVEQIIGSVLGQQSLFFTPKLVLIDEVDGLSGNDDRGGVSALVDVIEKSSYPIIMTANDVYSDKLKSLVKKCEVINLNMLKNEEVVKILKDICNKEKIVCDESSLLTIARKSQGDLRGAINDLEIVGRYTKSITDENVVSLSEREKKVSIMNALVSVLKNRDIEIARNAFSNIEETLDDVFMWLDENMPKEYFGNELALGYDALSKADVFNGRIRSTMHWRFLVYIDALMSAGVAVSKQNSKRQFLRYQRSSRPLTMWIMNNKYAKRKSIASKLALYTHSSSRSAVDNLFYIKKMFEKKECNHIIKELNLNEEEVEWLRKS